MVISSRGGWEDYIMESGWIINFKNGTSVILNENAYKKYQKETPKKDVSSEEHWFILANAIKEHPDYDLIEIENLV